MVTRKRWPKLLYDMTRILCPFWIKRLARCSQAVLARGLDAVSNWR
ncbi:hypothetical protein TR2A62_2436 [Thalassobium sp. R2A62]|nr:hypothetical protein TR2A62_2436 [Thalassobium sp. R2A62]